MSETILVFLAGGLIPLIITIIDIWKDNKRLKSTQKFEMKKLKREDERNLLVNVLLPIIELYEKSDRDAEFQELHLDAKIYGNGLNGDCTKTLDNIIKNNRKYLTIGVVKKYNEVQSDAELLELFNHFEREVEFMKQQNEPAIHKLFDDSRTFIDFVTEEAKRIEAEY